MEGFKILEFKFNIDCIKQFVVTKPGVLGGTWCIAFITALKSAFILCAISVMEITLMAIGEFMLWDTIKAMDNASLVGNATYRLKVLAIFSVTVNQYVMSWGGKITIINPFYFLVLFIVHF